MDNVIQILEIFMTQINPIANDISNVDPNIGPSHRVQSSPSEYLDVINTIEDASPKQIIEIGHNFGNHAEWIETAFRNFRRSFEMRTVPENHRIDEYFCNVMETLSNIRNDRGINLRQQIETLYQDIVNVERCLTAADTHHYGINFKQEDFQQAAKEILSACRNTFNIDLEPNSRVARFLASARHTQASVPNITASSSESNRQTRAAPPLPPKPEAYQLGAQPENDAQTTHVDTSEDAELARAIAMSLERPEYTENVDIASDAAIAAALAQETENNNRADDLGYVENTRSDEEIALNLQIQETEHDQAMNTDTVNAPENALILDVDPANPNASAEVIDQIVSDAERNGISVTWNFGNLA